MCPQTFKCTFSIRHHAAGKNLFTENDNISCSSFYILLFIWCVRCIPYKMTKDDDNDDPSSEGEYLKVLMVSSPNRDDLVFPKVCYYPLSPLLMLFIIVWCIRNIFL